MDWALPHPSLIKEMPHRLACGPIVGDHNQKENERLLDPTAVCFGKATLESQRGPADTSWSYSAVQPCRAEAPTGFSNLPAHCAHQVHSLSPHFHFLGLYKYSPCKSFLFWAYTAFTGALGELIPSSLWEQHPFTPPYIHSPVPPHPRLWLSL